MRIVIVDNDISALKYMEDILKSYTNIKSIHTFLDPIEALVFLLKNSIDALFLDIDMPSINGVYLAEQVLGVYPNTKICFVTAYNDYALRAFEINALDYILKPYEPDRIAQTIQRMNKEVQNRYNLEKVNNEYTYDLEIICGYEEEEVILIPYQDIYYIEVMNRCINIHTKDKVLRGNKTLSFYEAKLKNKAFFRTHKCFIVNLERIDKFKPRINYTYDMYFKDISDIVPLSRGKVKELKEYLEF